MRPLKVFFESSEPNCWNNTLESVQILNYIKSNGHKIIYNPDRADFIILNTCGVDSGHEDHTKKILESLLSSQGEELCGEIIVIGCLTIINPEIFEGLENVHILTDLSKLDDFFRVTCKYEEINFFMTKKKIYELRGSRTHRNIWRRPLEFKIIRVFMALLNRLLRILEKTTFSSDFLRNFLTEEFEKDKFYIQIAKGCLNNCSYCVIKKARGSLKSRPIKDIMIDLDTNYQGQDHIFLISDDVGSYGADTGTDIFELLNTITQKYPRAKIDLNYLHPIWLDRFPQRYLSLFKTGQIQYLWVSLQSGSEEILKKMNRNYNYSKVLQLINTIRKQFPSIMLITNLMVGFPGENTRNFLQTLSKLYLFDYGYPLYYTDRPGAPSTKLPNKIPLWRKKIRLYVLSAFIATNFFIKLFQKTFLVKQVAPL